MSQTNDLAEVEKFLGDMKFKKQIFGGISEAEAIAKIQKLSELYKEAFNRQKLVYETLLEEKEETIEKLRGIRYG